MLNDLEKDLARREDKLVSLGDAYSDFGNHIERLNNIARSAKQTTTLEAELGRLRRIVEEQVDLLKQDFL